MAVARFASAKPLANIDTLLYTVDKSSLTSIVAVNVSGFTRITAWIVPAGEDENPDNWIYYINNIDLSNRNTFETFKIAVNLGDKIYAKSESGQVTFFINGIFDLSGKTNVTSIGEQEPESPQIGDIWIRSDLDPQQIYYWAGELSDPAPNGWQGLGTIGPAGLNGSSGVVSVTSPITNSGTSSSANIGIDQSLISIAQSQVTGLSTALSGKADTSGTLAQFAATTSAQLAGVISNETGSGSLVFGTSPTIATPTLTLSTTTSTTAGRLARTGGQLRLGDGTTALTFSDDAALTIAQSQVTNLVSDLGTKENTISGAATTITSSNLTASRALASDGSGKVAVSNVTATELGYVSGVGSGIQGQLNNKLNITGGTLDNGANTGLEMVGTSAAFIDFKNSVADDFDARIINTGGAAGLTIAANPSLTTGSTLRNITVSTDAPSGGVDGDVWLRYV
jgi:hypothetical protein